MRLVWSFSTSSALLFSTITLVFPVVCVAETVVEADMAPVGAVAVQVPFACTTAVVVTPFENLRVTVLPALPVPDTVVEVLVKLSLIVGASATLL
ncbi:hypothetical protein NF418_02780 [Streptococcus suis]|uniref:hypothetical protein n=1 Tax=Streptococcus suis TaxID=1307 RepID=UPI00211895EE|nr:hypothetical protein [Streptococcus suis]